MTVLYAAFTDIKNLSHLQRIAHDKYKNILYIKATSYFYSLTSYCWNTWGNTHIETKTKWLPFCRQHLQIHLVEWKKKEYICILIQTSHKFGSHWQVTEWWLFAGSFQLMVCHLFHPVYGLKPNRWQVITWTNDGEVLWCHLATAS